MFFYKRGQKWARIQDGETAMNIRDKTLQREQCYVYGKWVGSDNGQTTLIVNPATGEPLGNVPDMGRQETRRAISGAEAALPGWRALTARARAAILRRWFNLIIENQEDLATILTLEQGKPLAEAQVRSRMPQASWNGSQKKESVYTGILSRRIRPTREYWY